MKLMVIGHARHGKDSVCNILRDKFGLSFVSSSYFVAEKAVRPYLAKLGRSYATLEDCYADRVNHRSDWFDAIAAYNSNDPARLGRELFAEYSIYCGIRNIKEFNALREEKAFDVCFWVDAGLRLDPEPFSSNTLTMDCANYIINNNGPVENLEREVAAAMKCARVSFPD